LIACVNHRGVSFATLRSFVWAAASAAGCKLDQLREQPIQRDFPVSAGAAPAMKSVIARIS
jgi:23S rRNA G2069 N7-methylase RlmK/C1962 C5-methylase RlmI